MFIDSNFLFFLSISEVPNSG